VTQVGVTAPLTVTNPTGPIVSLAIPAATSSNNGYLTATDWTTFNSKGTGNGTLSNVQGSGVITSSNPPGPSTTISISQATTSTSGYLSSTDWNTFNSKGAGTLQSVSGDGHTISSSNPTGPNTIISQPQATAFVDGYLNAADWLSFYLKQDATTFTAGTGITISGTSTAPVFTNSKPDQTVAIASGTGISATGTYPNFTVTNTAPDQTVAITAGTGITRTGTYPNFTITNSAPDQTVAITAGTGISVTGTYPNFTVASTGSSGNPTAFSSYGIFTQAPASLPASVSVVTATSTTVSKTSDWTNSGSGRYTFTGASPMKFRVEVSLNFTSATSNVKNFCVARNGVYPPTQAVLQAVDIHELPAVDNYVTPANTAYGRMFRSLTTFSMFNGDYLELVSYVQSASMSVTTWNIKIYNCEY
jgi:hypothetical protein